MSDDELRVDGSLSLPLSEIDWRFSTSGGPGGQHANKAETRAEARFDIAGSPSLNTRQRRRLIQTFGVEVRVSAEDTRSQSRNRELALERLSAKLAGALKVQRRRRPTRRTRGSNERRLAAKKRRSEIKKGRGKDWQ